MTMTGVWLGQTAGGYNPIHVWIIVQNGQSLSIYTHWLGLDHDKAVFWATQFPDDERYFHIQSMGRYIVQLDDNRFYVNDWVAVADAVEGDKLKRHLAGVHFQRLDTGIFAVIFSIYIHLFQQYPSMLRLLNR